MIEEIPRDFPSTAELCLPKHLDKPRLRREHAAQYLDIKHGIQVAVSTMAKWACVGGGPPYQKYNRTPLYGRDDLDRWAIERLGPVLRSTSDKGGNLQ
jgi:hypothetical protein